ncbi:MAG TPA: PIN domain-containing protein [Verrucomicrobiae bacterium]|jgi:predicted nucleic acid-binding protein
MATLIDSTLWVDYFRSKTPLAIKEQILPLIRDPGAVLCEPVRFEILRAALRSERKLIEEMFLTFPCVITPPALWKESVTLGQRALDAGHQIPAMDLLIAQLCLHHDLELITFDNHFFHVAKVCPLKVQILTRAG